jgi:hypothetical protein
LHAEALDLHRDGVERFAPGKKASATLGLETGNDGDRFDQRGLLLRKDGRALLRRTRTR